MLIRNFLLAILLISTASVAQTPQVSEAELKQTLLHYHGISELNVDFQQLKTLKEMKQPLRSKGHLTVRPPASVVYKITSPATLSVTLTPQTITIETGKGSEKTSQVLQVAALKGSREHRNLQAMVSWLEMNPHDLAANYKITRLADHQFHFVPLKADDAPFTALDMTVSKNGDVSDLVMHEMSGDQIEFQFSTPTIQRKK